MNRSVFEIRGLECGYRQKGKNGCRVVLQIGKLSLPMGKVTMILGPSGSGKSTLIETLGLMNNTIRKGSVTYYHDEKSFTIDQEAWKHQRELAGMRKNHFSFIFQNDFLMPYYTSEENMMIGGLIRGFDKTALDEKETPAMISFCREMGLDYDEIKLKKPPVLSVGQRQRLSFIRAMVKEYSVIFGDEPTGNLDERNSELLLDVLNRSISLNSRQSAILVSHNITLSVAKADFIIVLSPSGELFEVLSGNVFSRTPEGWLNGNNTSFTDRDLIDRIRKIVDMSLSDECKID